MTFNKIYKFLFLYLVILFLLLAVSGCTTTPKSNIYYPPTQEEIDQRVIDDRAADNLWIAINFALGVRK